MPGSVSCRLYLRLDALENFDISRDQRSSEISNFPTHLEVKPEQVVVLGREISCQV